jgi:SAM-dependent methyltransferase
MDAVIAGQAFHWFDVEKCKAEFKRILKQDGLVVLIWNERKMGSAFEKDYEDLINKHGKDYVKVSQRNIDEASMTAFFAPAPMNMNIFPNEQVFDFDGLQGRLLSSSYMPLRKDAGYNEMIVDLKQLFEKYQQNGEIRIGYDTKVYTGRLK